MGMHFIWNPCRYIVFPPPYSNFASQRAPRVSAGLYCVTLSDLPLDSLLAVRTFGSLSILSLKQSEKCNEDEIRRKKVEKGAEMDEEEIEKSVQDLTIGVETVARLSRSHLNGEKVVDLQPFSTSMGFLTIGHDGGLFDCTFGGGTKIMSVAAPLSIPFV